LNTLEKKLQESYFLKIGVTELLHSKTLSDKLYKKLIETFQKLCTG